MAKAQPFTEDELVRQGYTPEQAKRMVFMEKTRNLPEVHSDKVIRQRVPRRVTTRGKAKPETK